MIKNIEYVVEQDLCMREIINAWDLKNRGEIKGNCFISEITWMPAASKLVVAISNFSEKNI